jgi:hypothetical protein
MKFPREGSEKERDDAVVRVQSALNANPQMFDGLKAD